MTFGYWPLQSTTDGKYGLDFVQLIPQHSVALCCMALDKRRPPKLSNAIIRFRRVDRSESKRPCNPGGDALEYIGAHKTMGKLLLHQVKRPLSDLSENHMKDSRNLEEFLDALPSASKCYS